MEYDSDHAECVVVVVVVYRYSSSQSNLLHRYGNSHAIGLRDHTALASTPPGMPGTHTPNILVGGTSTAISPNIITYFRI